MVRGRMRSRILAIGEKMPDWTTLACQDYLKRFDSRFALEVVEIPAPKRSKTSVITQMKALEADSILGKLPKAAHCILLDVKGRSYTTEALSKRLNEWFLMSKDLYWVIGGADGFDERCYARADEMWSLSPLTFPHPLVRVLLVEQLYRAHSILQGHPYHRA